MEGRNDCTHHRRVFPRHHASRRFTADGQRVPLRTGSSEVSGMLGRLPSRVGYQPTLTTEIAELEERIASVAGASVTAIQAVYVPADDFTDPAVVAIFRHLDSSVLLSRDLAAEGLHPASIRPALSRCCSIHASSAPNTTQLQRASARPLRATRNCGSHLAARNRGAERRGSKGRCPRQAARAFPRPAFYGYRTIHGNPRKIGFGKRYN